MMQFDDMGLDEFDVADERQHEIGFDRWEINIDTMSYEELLNLYITAIHGSICSMVRIIS